MIMMKKIKILIKHFIEAKAKNNFFFNKNKNDCDIIEDVIKLHLIYNKAFAELRDIRSY